MREFVARLLESIAGVGCGPFEEEDFWTEPVVDKDGNEAVGEQKVHLCGAQSCGRRTMWELPWIMRAFSNQQIFICVREEGRKTYR
jgi:hypothetical protein